MGPGRISTHLQGSGVVLQLRQPLSDLAVGHCAAEGVAGAFQELQFLLMLPQGLRVLAWASRRRRLQPGRPSSRLRPLGRADSGRQAGRSARSPYPHPLPGTPP